MGIRATSWLAAAALLLVGLPGVVTAGNFNRSAVGGVSINPEGILSEPTVEARQELQTARTAALDPQGDDLQKQVPLRKVSLRRLEEAIAAHRASQFVPLPDEVQYLAGLQRVQYVFVYPEQHDIVLAGPAEGWNVDASGNVVGKSSGRPVLLLDDLLVALRTASAARQGGLSCSIDPTPEGLANVQRLAKQLREIGNPQQTAGRIEAALGPQVISVTGVPRDSHFARVMVASDYRMKRLAMNFDPSPVKEMPSFMHLVKAGNRGMRNMLPRWWMTPTADALLTDPEGLSWELRNVGVRCLTENDFVAASGQKAQTGQSDPVAARWAATFSEKFDELAAKETLFGQLRNLMDLSVAAALIEKENMVARAGVSLPQLLGEEPTESYNGPKQVASRATLMKKGRNWVISASGGVRLEPWKLAERREESNGLSGPRDAAAPAGDSWWWN